MEISRNLRIFGSYNKRIDCLIDACEKYKDEKHKDNAGLLMISLDSFSLVNECINLHNNVVAGTLPEYYSEMDVFLKERYGALRRIFEDLSEPQCGSKRQEAVLV